MKINRWVGVMSVLCLCRWVGATTPTPQYYVDAVSGSDANPGTQAKPWKTIRAVANADVILVNGETYPVTGPGLSFDAAPNAWVGAPGSRNPAVIQAGPNGAYCLQYSASVAGCVLSNVTITSSDGKGTGGNVHGSNGACFNVNLGNLNEGLDYSSVQGWTIYGGSQTGKVAGRCHYLLDVDGLTWIGAGGSFGPASSQSPVRISSPGLRNAYITGVTVNQSASTFPIACWAVHCCDNVTFDHCSAIGGEFSFNSAGDGAALDVMENVAVANLTVTNSRLTFDAGTISGVTVTDPTITNATGECIGVSSANLADVSISGATLSGPKPGVHFYAECLGLTLKNSTLTAPTAVPFMDGLNVPANDGGGNKVVAGKP